jgi:minor extracellular serine protease Vpr
MNARTVMRLGSRLVLVLLGLAGARAAGAFEKPRVPVIAAFGAAPAATPAQLKMDPGLRMVLERARESAARGLPLRSSSRFAALTSPASPFDVRLDAGERDPALSVFMRLEHERDADALAALGAQILLQRGELVMARIPLSNVEPVAELPAVRALALSQRWNAVLDSSRVRLGVKDVQQGAGGLPQAYQGTGVLVGVLDSGLDYTHQDFRTAAGTRLKGLFDFSLGANGGECSVAQLDGGTCPEIDGTGGFGHGTHVTGIAAGNGRTNPVYVGMAPEADLLFVKGLRDPQSNGGFSDIDIINGVAWMIDKSFVVGEPIAINLSLGGQLGAHDGTSIQEQFLDHLAGPGRIIVAAAGNSGADPIHVSYAVQGTNYNTALETPWLFSQSVGFAELWAPAATTMAVGIAVYDPANPSAPVFIGPAANPGQKLQGTASFTVNGNTIILGDVTIDALTTADANNGARNVQITVAQNPNGIDVRSAIWSIYTTGSGTFDMWALAGSIFPTFTGQPSYFRSGDNNKTIGIPATAKRLLCVGSHVTKTQWVDVDDTLRIRVGATLDNISSFSSRGPSRDGRVLPNFTAGGEAIISALSKDFPAERRNIVQGGSYQEQQGTSQASPHVTGIVALMLERDPALTPENARAILQQSATPAGGGVPNNTFGYGRIRALQALLATPDPLACTVTLPNGTLLRCDQVASQPLALMAYPSPAAGSMRFSFLSPARQPVRLALYDLLGRRVRTLIDGVVEPGVQSPRWEGDDDRGRPVPNGVYLARLVTPDATRSIRLVLAR